MWEWGLKKEHIGKQPDDWGKVWIKGTPFMPTLTCIQQLKTHLDKPHWRWYMFCYRVWLRTLFSAEIVKLLFLQKRYLQQSTHRALMYLKPLPAFDAWFQVQDELIRARSLLRGSDSVESVIRLLDETFQRLQTEVASSDVIIEAKSETSDTITKDTRDQYC